MTSLTEYMKMLWPGTQRRVRRYSSAWRGWFPKRVARDRIRTRIAKASRRRNWA